MVLTTVPNPIPSAMLLLRMRCGNLYSKTKEKCYGKYMFLLDVTGSPRLVTLRLESLMRDPSGISHAYGQRRAFADEHMPVPTGPGPRRSTQSIYNTRLSEVHTTHQYLL